MLELQDLLIIPVSLLAFVLKSVATFGPGIVLVPLGALLVGAREIVIVIGLLDLVSNVSLWRPGQNRLKRSFWVPMVAAMVAGSVLGAVMLVVIPAEHVELVLGLMLLPLGLWFIAPHKGARADALSDQPPERAGRLDTGLCAVAGVMGGLAGITGPVLAWHLGRRYRKQAFRSIMIPILLASAMTRAGMYVAAGLVTRDVMVLVLLALPGLFMGLWIGNRLFARVPQQWFSRVVGALICLSGVKLLAR